MRPNLVSGVPVFLSVSRPQTPQQDRFLMQLTATLEEHGLAPHTIGVTERCVGSPLPVIRRLMTEVHGLVVVAFRRTWVAGLGSWHTSVFCQLEAAMAYQRELPILVAREQGVTVEGMLETAPGCRHLPEFDLEEHGVDDIREWLGPLAEWSAGVRAAGPSLRDAPPPTPDSHVRNVGSWGLGVGI